MKQGCSMARKNKVSIREKHLMRLKAHSGASETDFLITFIFILSQVYVE